LSEGTADAPGFSLLFVCTGNICRSPMGEVMAAAELARLVPGDAGRFYVSSAGTHGLADHPIDAGAAHALAALGLTAERFRARILDHRMVEQSDLVLTATRRHRAAAVTMWPRASARTFTILEFARLVALVPPGEMPDTADPVERAKAMVAAAAGQRGRVYVDPHLDDVDDPYGLGREDFRECAEIVGAGVRAICRALVEPGSEPGADLDAAADPA
jgi:protein-tyrosine phosphatase